MKCVILAAGKGTRLLPLTENRPKPMIPIGGLPLIDRTIDCLKKNRIKEVILIVGYKKEAIQEFLKEGKSLGVNIEYVDQPELLGTADAIKRTESHVGREDFLAINGDLFIRPGAISRILEEHEKTGESVIGVTTVENPERYGLVMVKGSYVSKIIEKPTRIVGARANLINAGIYVLKEKIFDAMKATGASTRGEFEITETLNRYIKSGEKVRTALLDREDRMDVGCPWDLLEANERAFKDMRHEIKGKIEDNVSIIGQVKIEGEAKILSGSRIEGPAFIGKNSSLGPNCYIRPYTSIERDVKIGNACEIKNSIVMNGTKIPHLSYVGDSIIGAGCNLGAGTITGNIRLDGKNVRMKIKNKIVDSGRRKLGVVIGDNVMTAINVSFMPGVKVGSNTFVGPNIVVYRDIPSGSKVLLEQRLSENNL